MAPPQQRRGHAEVQIELASTASHQSKCDRSHSRRHGGSVAYAREGGREHVTRTGWRTVRPPEAGTRREKRNETAEEPHTAGVTSIWFVVASSSCRFLCGSRPPRSRAFSCLPGTIPTTCRSRPGRTRSRPRRGDRGRGDARAAGEPHRRATTLAGARLPLVRFGTRTGCEGRWLHVGLSSWVCSDLAELSPKSPRDVPPHRERRASVPLLLRRQARSVRGTQTSAGRRRSARRGPRPGFRDRDDRGAYGAGRSGGSRPVTERGWPCASSELPVPQAFMARR